LYLESNKLRKNLSMKTWQLTHDLFSLINNIKKSHESIGFFQCMQFLKCGLILYRFKEVKEGTREFSLDARIDPSRAKERREREGEAGLKGRERGERERETERNKTGHDARDEHTVGNSGRAGVGTERVGRWLHGGGRYTRQWGIRVDDAGGPRRHETPVSLWSTRSRAANPLSFTEHRSPQPWVTRFVLRTFSTNNKKEER